MELVGGKTLQRLAAESEIRDVIHRMPRAVDRLDEDLALSCYHEGATESHLGFEGSFRDYVRTTWRMLRERFSWTMHLIGNIVVEFPRHDDSVAFAESYVVAWHSNADPVAAPGSSFSFGGRYVDRFERRPTPEEPEGAWRIAARVFVWDWRLDVDPAAWGSPKPGAIAGRRDRDDVVYQVRRSVLG